MSVNSFWFFENFYGVKYGKVSSPGYGLVFFKGWLDFWYGRLKIYVERWRGLWNEWLFWREFWGSGGYGGQCWMPTFWWLYDAGAIGWLWFKSWLWVKCWLWKPELARLVFWKERLSRLSSGLFNEGFDAAITFRWLFLGSYLAFLKLGGMYASCSFSCDSLSLC